MARHHRRSLRRRITDLVDTLLGRTRPRRANLDQLFALPSAAITLPASPPGCATGHALGRVPARRRRSVRHRATGDPADLLNTGSGPTTEVQRDEYGYTWLVGAPPPSQEGGGLTGLVTDLHAVNSSPGKRRVRAVPAGLARSLRCPGRAAPRPRLPVQAGNVLPLRPQRRPRPGQRPRTPGQRRTRRGTGHGNGQEPLVPRLRCARPVTGPAPVLGERFPAHYRGAYRDRS